MKKEQKTQSAQKTEQKNEQGGKPWGFSGPRPGGLGKKSRGKSYQYFIISLLIVVLLNVVGFSLFRKAKLDFTKNKAYTLSPLSRKIVSDLAEPVRIRLFFSKNIPAPYDNIEGYLRDILSEYNSYSNAKIQYTFYDTTLDKEDNPKIKENIATAGRFGIERVSVPKIDKGSQSVVDVYMGMVMEYGTREEKIGVVRSSDQLEFLITSKLDRLISYQKAIDNLQGKIDVGLYVTDDFIKVGKKEGIRGTDEIFQNMEEAVKALNESYDNKLEYHHYGDYQNDEATKKMLDELNMPIVRWGQSKETPAGQSATSAVVRFGGRAQGVDLISVEGVRLTQNGLERQYSIKDSASITKELDDALRRLLGAGKQLKVIRPEGGFNPFSPGSQDEYGNFMSDLSDTYNVSTVDLKKPSWSDGNDPLLVIGTGKPFSEEDLYRIDQHLMRGGNLIVFQEGVKTDVPEYAMSQPLQPQVTGLEKLLKNYGVVIDESVLLDEQSFERMAEQERGRGATKMKIRFVPQLTSKEINTQFAPLRAVKNMYFFQTSPVSLVDEVIKGSSLKVHPLFTSSDKAWKGKSMAEMFPTNESMSFESKIPLGYVVEGQFNSYYKDKATEGTLTQSVKGAKVLVIGGKGILSNQFYAFPENKLAVMNLVDYVSGNEEWAPLREKIDIVSPLDPYDEKSGFLKALFTKRPNLQYINMIGLPVFVIVVGAIVYILRKRRQRTISRFSNEAKQ